MALNANIDDYTDGARGAAESNGHVVAYTIHNVGDVGQNGDAVGLATDNGSVSSVTIDFDDEVSGIQVYAGAMLPNDFATLLIDGNPVNINDLVASGDIVLNPEPNSLRISDDGRLHGSDASGSSYLAFTVNARLGSIGIQQTSSGLDTNGFDFVLTEDFVAFPCFTAGTLIDTDQGAVPVETLQAGDRVRTKDHGFQPVKWVGGSRVMDAPVRIKAGTFGNARDLVVSPRHRMLLKGWQMGLLFNHDEAFAAAKDMQNGSTITMEPEGWVTYYHVLLDRHEVIYAEGAETESFFPDEASLNSMAKKTREELAQAVDLSTYGKTVRPTLTPNQAMYLSHNMDLLEDEQPQVQAAE